jgi:hypothetical protein
MSVDREVPSASSHRLVGFVRALDAALDRVAEVEPVFLSVAEKRTALVGLRREQDRLAGLTLRVLAASAEVAEVDGARDAAAWLAVETRTERGRTPPTWSWAGRWTGIGPGSAPHCRLGR